MYNFKTDSRGRIVLNDRKEEGIASQRLQELHNRRYMLSHKESVEYDRLQFALAKFWDDTFEAREAQFQEIHRSDEEEG